MSDTSDPAADGQDSAGATHQSSESLSEVPGDVVIARAINTLTRSVGALSALTVALSLLTLCALLLAGDRWRQPVFSAGLAGGVVVILLALLACAIVSSGLTRVLADERRSDSHSDSGSSAVTDSQVTAASVDVRAAAAAATHLRTARRIGWVMRATLGAGVVIVALVALTRPDALTGGLVGAVFCLQVWFVLRLIDRTWLDQRVLTTPRRSGASMGGFTR